MTRVRVHNFAVSLAGYAAAPRQSLDHPLGIGGERLHQWAFATRTFGQSHGTGGAERGIDDDFIARGEDNIGATIQQFLRAGLIDDMHLAIVPILLGSGERLLEHLDAAGQDLKCVELVSSAAVTHVRLVRQP
jgi:hypothetical protein